MMKMIMGGTSGGGGGSGVSADTRDKLWEILSRSEPRRPSVVRPAQLPATNLAMKVLDRAPDAVPSALLECV